MKVQFSNTNMTTNNYSSSKSTSTNSNKFVYSNSLNNSKQISFSGLFSGLGRFFKSFRQEDDLAKLIEARVSTKEPVSELEAEINKIPTYRDQYLALTEMRGKVSKELNEITIKKPNMTEEENYAAEQLSAKHDEIFALEGKIWKRAWGNKK